MSAEATNPPLSGDLLQAVLRQTSDVVLVLDPSGRVARSFGARHMGYADSELVARDVFEIVHADDLAFARRQFSRICDGESVAPLTIRGLHADHAARWYDVSPARYVADDEGVWIVVVIRDVHERNLAENSIRESERRYRSLVDQSPLGIIIVDRELNLVTANEAYARQVGAPSLDALRGHNIMASPAFDAQKLEAVAARVRNGESISTSLSYESLFGRQVDVRVNISPLRDERGEFSAAQMVFEDVSESRRLEEQLRESQKMEAVGRLAGGIAHDFNNNLTVILGLAGLLAQGQTLSEDDREAAGEILGAAERSAALTRQLLAFGRHSGATLDPIDPGAVVERLDRMLRRVLGETIRLSCSTASGLPPIEADPKLLEQVVLNLAVNAKDAMPAGGELRIDVSRDNLGEVVLSVDDDGTGMDEITRARCFEPFFTSKGTGEGTGLGLAVVYGIVQQFHGTIEIQSSPGKGTHVRMAFPALEGETAVSPLVERGAEARERESGGERVLVLEDQKPVRSFLSETLRRNGYDVLEAESSTQALALAARADPAIDLLLSDVRVPDLSGPETASRLRAESPELRVLYVSGYNDLPIDTDSRMADGFEVLAKPFSVRRLLDRVRASLNQPTPATQVKQGPG